MKIDLVAVTQLVNPGAFSDQWAPEGGVSDAESLIEGAGRACYQSWGRPNPHTATNAGYVKHLLDVGHLSVLEHGTATFYFQGVSRSFTHELIRSRHFSYSQLSQRYVNEETAESVTPAAYDKHFPFDVIMAWRQRFDTIKEEYVTVVDFLEKKGLTRKQAREAARADLPNRTETKIVVTGNFRAWRQFAALRATEFADAEICAAAVEVLLILQAQFPNVFGDFVISRWEGKDSDGRLIAKSPVSAPC